MSAATVPRCSSERPVLFCKTSYACIYCDLSPAFRIKRQRRHILILQGELSCHHKGKREREREEEKEKGELKIGSQKRGIWHLGFQAKRTDRLSEHLDRDIRSWWGETRVVWVLAKVCVCFGWWIRLLNTPICSCPKALLDHLPTILCR